MWKHKVQNPNGLPPFHCIDWFKEHKITAKKFDILAETQIEHLANVFIHKPETETLMIVYKTHRNASDWA
jgi:hypothetical protein